MKPFKKLSLLVASLALILGVGAGIGRRSGIASADGNTSLSVVKSVNQLISENNWTVSSGNAIGSKVRSFNLDNNISVSLAVNSGATGNSGTFWGTSTYDYRLYQNDGPVITISSKSGYALSNIKFNYAVNNAGVLLDSSSNEVKSNTDFSVANSSSVSFSVGNTGSKTNGQVRITSFNVDYSSTSSTKTLSKIELSGTYKTSFEYGETFTYSGAVVTATYSDNSTADVTSLSTWSTPNMKVSGNQTVTVTHQGKTCSYQITIGECTFEDVLALNNKSRYIGRNNRYLSTVAATGSCPQAVYADNEEKAPSLLKFTLVDDNTYIIGESETQCLYSTDNNGNLRYGNPSGTWKNRWHIFEDSNNPGCVFLTLTFDNGSVRYLSTYDSITNVDFRTYTNTTNATGIKLYSELPATKSLSSITLNEEYVTEFNTGDLFTHSDVVVTAHYSDDSTEDVTSSCNWDSSNVNMLEAGTYTVTVSYTYLSVTKTTNYSITVVSESYRGDSKNNAMTVSEAIEYCESNNVDSVPTSKVFFVTGIIKSIDTAWNPTYKNLSFTFVGGLKAYRAASETNPSIEAGDTATVSGLFKKFNDSYEFDGNVDNGCVLVDYQINPKTVQSVLLNESKLELEVGDIYETLVPSFEPANPDNKAVTWSSSNEEVAEVEDGVIYAYSIGKTVITVKTVDGEKTASCEVDVVEKGTATKKLEIDLSTDKTTEATDEKMTWDFENINISVNKGTSGTATNNYYPGTQDKNYTSTRFYKDSILTFTPKTSYSIISVTFRATTGAYATALSNSTWTNATASTDSTAVNITPTEPNSAFSVTIGGTTGGTAFEVYYRSLGNAVDYTSFKEDFDAIDPVANVGFSYEMKEDEFGKEITASEFKLQVGISKVYIDMLKEDYEDVDFTFGIKVHTDSTASCGAKNISYSENQLHYDDENEIYYLVLGLGDAVANPERLKDVFYITPYAVLDGETYYSKNNENYFTVEWILSQAYVADGCDTATSDLVKFLSNEGKIDF